ncbi:MAG: cation:proton antiporter [Bacteroidales bacterium]|nr:cation:proton antiporter [Bacteroidales bacterium]
MSFTSLLSIQFPFSEPVIIITMVLLILLIGPVFFERVRIPSIVGLLISGAIIGPHGFNLVSPDLEFSLLGTMGLLYLMFLAGLEIDLIDFIENKAKSIFIGLATFVLPFILGYLVCRYLLHYEVIASWLIAAMLSSHTLISYPLLGRLGIVSKPIVTVIVGATIIADILALVAMELITNFADKGFEMDSLLMLGLHFLLLFFVVFLVIPRLSRVFLNKYEGDLGVQYIFVLVILFASSLVAYLLEIEPILGAFFSGLVLNRLIINSSPLYKRIEFIGSNLFIPFFLISIGILANFKVYLNQPVQLVFLIVMIITALAGKYLAALLSRLILKTSKTETDLIFGLSVSRAASAIAIILIGFNMGFIPEAVLNNTVILILVTSISSSYITQKAGKKLLFEEDTINGGNKVKQKILVPVANPSNMENLLEFASLIKVEDNNIPVYPLTIFTNQTEVRTNIDKTQQRITKVIDSLQSDVSFETSSRIDNNVTNGIVRAAEEVIATAIVMGWNKSKTPFHILFGNVLKNLLNKTERMVIVLKTPSTFRQIRKIHLLCPENAQYEKGFHLWLDTLGFLIKKLQLKASVDCNSSQTLEAIQYYTSRNGTLKYFDLQQNEVSQHIKENIRNSSAELLVFIHSRKKTISYSKTFEGVMNSTMARFNKNNIVLIYPEQ